MEQAREGHLADLTYVKLPEDGRWATFPRLPYVGEGWYAKPAAAYMLEKGIATWNDFAWSLDATAHVDQESVTQALQQMEAAWPEGEEHYAKLSVNALIGLWAHNMDLIYTMRTSNHQFDGSGCQHRELFLDAAGGMHWDHIYVTQLLSNRSCARLRDGLGVRRGLPHPGRTGRRVAEVPEGREDGLRRLPGPAQKVAGPRGRPCPRKASRRHARVSVRGGQGPRGPVPDPPNRGQVSLLQHGELEGRGRPRAPLPRRRRPAADGLPGHRENLPGTPDRDRPPGRRVQGQDHHQNPLLRAELRHAGGDGRPLGAEHRPERVLQHRLAGGGKRSHSWTRGCGTTSPASP